MTLAGYAAGAAVVALLGAIAAGDARRARISPVLVGLLLLAGAAWLFAGGGGHAVTGPLWMHALGALAGAGVPALLIIAAEVAGRRWPIYPGDAMLLGAVGAILGARALAWAVALGCGLALAQRVCIQRKRGRPIGAGWLPAGPGLALGAALVFGALNAGFALAEEGKAAAGGDPARIVATELLPVKTPAPDEVAGREIALEVPTAIAFSDLVARIGRAGGIEVAIEERPSRIEGGRAELPEPAPMLPGGETRLGLLLDDVAARAGYAWEWNEGRAVFYRYWDREWIASRPGSAPAVEIADPEPPDDPFAGVVAWLGRIFGGGREDDAPAAETAAATREAEGGPEPDAPPEEAGTAAGEEKSAGAETASLAGRTEPPDGGAAAEDAAAQGAPPEAAEPDPPVWAVVPEEQKTLRGVLEAWAEKAEWKVAWRAPGDFRIGAAATFEGEFLEAVDSLLSDPSVSRVLTARAHSNRYLVIEGAGR